MAVSGYTLPVFACASALAALRILRGDLRVETVTLDLIEPDETVSIAIEQVAKISPTTALAITRSAPGDNLDLTRFTPIWALVELSLVQEYDPEIEQVTIEGGEGIGIQLENEGKAAIYSYAKRLLKSNLSSQLQPEERLKVTIILPEGRRLAEHTSNAAFGVVKGLSLLGTTGISQPLTAPDQLDKYIAELTEKKSKTLVFCIGENGYDLAGKMGIDAAYLVKTANWLGPLLVAAGEHNIQKILLLGYHGKLIKLAGGIFHTHHHLADGRLEILTAYGAKVGLSTSRLQEIFNCSTADNALKKLAIFSTEDQEDWVKKVYQAIVESIQKKSEDYIRKHSEKEVQIGTILFNRERQTIITSPVAQLILEEIRGT